MNLTTSEEPIVHARRVTAFFETRPAAEKARADVLATGLSHEVVKITDGRGTATGDAAASSATDATILDKVKHAFEPSHLQQPGFVVSAQVPDSEYDVVRAILGEKGQIG